MRLVCGLHAYCFAGAYVYLNFQLIKATVSCGISVSLQTITTRLTAFVLLLVLQTQRYMWTTADTVRIAK